MTPEREVRVADVALRVATVLAIAGVSFTLFVGYRLSERAHAGWAAEQRAAPPADPPVEGLSVVTAASTVAQSVTAPSVPAAPSPATPTDVVLLPCREPSPRPDGRFLIPPHDPTRRTIVGLPSRPGEPKQGLVIPPHDPGKEHRVPFEVVPLDSILQHTIRIPPHDPDRYKLIRRDTLPCLGS